MKTVFTLLMLSFVIVVVGQTKPEHKKKFYKRDDGRLFVNKDIPLYLHISDSRENLGEHYVLESESSPKYSAPFFLDTEGYNTIRTPSKVDPETRKIILPKSDVIFEMYADGVAPVSIIHYKSAPLVETSGKLYFGKGLEISLSSKDKISGVEQILFSIDSKPYIKYDTPLKFPEERPYLLNAYAVDNVGNVEQGKLLKFIPDYTAPETKIEIKKDFTEKIFSGRTTIVLNSEDNLSGVKTIFYKYDDGKKKIFNGLVSPGWITEGEHTMYYFAKDKVDNKETERSLTFFMDKTPPDVKYEIIGDKFTSATNTFISAQSKIKLEATDNKAGVKEVYYSINGKKPSLYTEPFLIDQKATNLNIRYYGIDNVNNSNENKSTAGSTSLNLKILRDNKAPKLAIKYKGPNIIVNKILYLRETSTITLYASDNLSGVKEVAYVLDTVRNIYKKSFSVKEEGKHKITYSAKDNTNNESVESLEFYIDNNGPKITIQFGIGSIGEDEIEGAKVDVYPPRTSLFITATDQLVGYSKILYSLNKAPEVESKGIIKNMKEGNYDITVRALDKLGNESTKNLKFIIRR